MVGMIPDGETINVGNEIERKGQRKRYGVLLCAEDSEYIKGRFGGYFGLFVKMLSEEGENWSVFRVIKDEFPNEDEIQMFDGFVISGSCSDAHSNHLWILNLISFVKKLDLLKKKVLGICFGHQLMGRALGGKTGRASSGWDIGLRTIHMSHSLNKGTSNLKIPSTLNILECHQDEILELPTKVEVIGGSNKTSVEMFRYGDHMMGIQGHPEYDLDILVNLIDRLLLNNFIEVNYANELRAMLVESHEPDKEAWRKLCIDFLKGRSDRSS